MPCHIPMLLKHSCKIARPVAQVKWCLQRTSSCRRFSCCSTYAAPVVETGTLTGGEVAVEMGKEQHFESV